MEGLASLHISKTATTLDAETKNLTKKEKKQIRQLKVGLKGFGKNPGGARTFKWCRRKAGCISHAF